MTLFEFAVTTARARIVATRLITHAHKLLQGRYKSSISPIFVVVNRDCPQPAEPSWSTMATCGATPHVHGHAETPRPFSSRKPAHPSADRISKVSWPDRRGRVHPDGPCNRDFDVRGLDDARLPRRHVQRRRATSSCLREASMSIPRRKT